MAELSSRPPVLAIDLGGTKIVASLVAADYSVLATERYATGASEGPDSVINRLLYVIDHLLEQYRLTAARIEAISIAAAGAIDMESGIITVSPNLPGWKDIPLRSRVRERYGASTFLLNDAKAAALGEHRLGAGMGASYLVLLTVGTGIGGGIIVNKKLYFGASGSASELGHMTIDRHGPPCPCGNIGCLEVLASGTAIGNEARRRIAAGEASMLTGMVQDDLSLISAKNVEAAARSGDRLSLDVAAWAGANLGVGLVNLVNIFNPEVIVIGGGVSHMGELLLGPARRMVQERAMPLSARRVKITTARLGNDAGIYGAAIYAFEKGPGNETS